MTMGSAQQPHPDQPAVSVDDPQDWALRQQNLRREVDLRMQAVQRMRYMNRMHAMHAWERRYEDPIAPYGLAFLYAQPAPRQGWHTLCAATKLWLAGPEASDLPRLLFELNGVVADQLTNPRFDLRRDLANRVDENMSDDARYVGLGVSSLDTYSGTWTQACASVDRDDRDGGIPGVIRITMSDSTIILCERRGTSEFNELKLRSTHALGISTLDSLYPWSIAQAQDCRSDPTHGPVLRWMEELNLNLWRLDTLGPS